MVETRHRFAGPAAVLTVLALCLGGLAPAAAQAPGYRLYANPKGYQVEIPADWLQDPTAPPAVDSQYRSTDGQADLVVQADTGSLAPDLQQALADLEVELRKQHPGFSSSVPQPTALPGADAAVLTGGAWIEGTSMWAAYVVLAEQGTTLYSLRLVVTWEYHTVHNAQLNHMLESYRLVGTGRTERNQARHCCEPSTFCAVS